MKTFQLIDTKPVKGALNIPIFWTMTNHDMAVAISEEIGLQREQFGKWGDSVQEFVTILEHDPSGIFIDPCLETCPDAFVCAFGIS